MLIIKNGIKKLSIISMIVIIVVMNASSVVFAGRSDVDAIVYISENQPEVLSICSKANHEAGKDILVYTGRDGLLSFSNELYSELPVNERKEFMETALLSVKESGMNSKIKNKVYNFIADQDTTTSAAVKYLRSDASTDFASAAAWFKPFGNAFGVVLGLISLFIFMFMGLSILLDVAYMVLPGFRVVVEGGKYERPKWITREAYSAVKEAESGLSSGEYKSYMSLYFKRRVPSLILMSIALGYLISGQIYDIVVYLIDSFTWVFTK